jgi:glutaredoxin
MGENNMAYQLYGTRTCGRCKIVKSQLDLKGIDYEYHNIEDLSHEEADEVIRGAVNSGNGQMPIIILDGAYVSFEEVK